MKYFLSIASIFKNEYMILEEWINHYLKEGVEHFYLINHGSTDDFHKIIDRYSNYITLVNDRYKQESHFMDYLLNKHFLTKIKLETEWVIVCDIDEYIYNKHNYKNIKHFLNNKGQVKNDVGTIWIPWKLFFASSNNSIKDSIINETIQRRPELKNRDYGDGKSIYRTSDLVQLNIHHGSNPYCYRLNKEIKNNKKDFNRNNTLILDINSNLYCNHYRFISKEYYEKIKCNRGGQTKRQNFIYTMEFFNKVNSEKDKITDTILKNKKYKLNNLIQTYHSINDIVNTSKNSYLEHNSNFEYKFFNDEECKNFILDNFDIELLNIYNKIIPKAFKADLFRYCYLYIHGGIYADIDTICLENLNDLLDINYDIVLVKERTNIPGIFQAFIISKPKQLLFLNAINKIKDNVNNNYYGNSKYKHESIINILSITGPVLLGNTICNMLKIPEFTINQIFNNDIKLDNCYIKILNFTNNGYINYNENSNYLIKVKNNDYIQEDNYKELFKNKKIFN